MFNIPKTESSTKKSFTFNCGCIVTVDNNLNYCHWAYCAIHLYAQESFDANKLAKTALLNTRSIREFNDDVLTTLTTIEEAVTSEKTKDILNH